jgi:hypothetical protein
MRLYRKRYALPERDGSLSFGDDKVRVTVTPEFPTEIREVIGYWHKANAIHGWFVDYVQEGNDDQEEYEVTRAQLETLRAVVLDVLASSQLIPGRVSVGYHSENGKVTETWEAGKVIKDSTVARDMLPTREGFFFGSEHYDEWYVDDLKHTKLILDTALKSRGDVTFTYQADW